MVGQLNKYNTIPKKGHLRKATRVIRYLKDTMLMDLVFRRKINSHLPKEPPPDSFIRYANSNFAEDPTDRESIIDYCFFLNRVVVLWSSKKQRTMSTSITKAEYIVLGHAARETVQIRRFINKIKMETVKNLRLFGDNKMSIALTKNAKNQHQTKYNDVPHYFIKKLVNKRELTIKQISESRMLADGMTKALSNKTFKRYQALLRIAVEQSSEKSYLSKSEKTIG